MAVPTALATIQSARLLRLQQLREQRVRSETAQAAAAREAAAGVLRMAALRAQEADAATEAAARQRWDGAQGTMLRHVALHVLREAERVGQEELRQRQERVAAATRDHVAATQAAQAAQAALVACTMLTVRRERLASDCAARLRRHARHRADAAAEDDLPAPRDA